MSFPQPMRQGRRTAPELGRERLLHRPGVPSYRNRVPRWGADPDAGLAVVSREDTGIVPLLGEELDRRPRQGGVVRVADGTLRAAVLDDLRCDRAGHAGGEPIGSDHESGPELHGRPAAVVTMHAGRAP